MGVRVYRDDDASYKAYGEDLKFWANALGELHCPHGVQPYDITEDELPDELKRVYNDLFFEPSCGASLRYMVETEKGYGIALLNEYDRVTSETSGIDFGPLFETVVQDAQVIAEDALFAGCEIFVGECLGFDGCHELVVVFPWDVPVEEFVQAAAKLDDLVYCACGINRPVSDKGPGTRDLGPGVEYLNSNTNLNSGERRGENEGLSVDNVESLVADWLQRMRMQEGELIYAKNLDIQSDDYKKMVGLVADLCKREFPDLYEVVFGDGAGTMDLIFKDKRQDGCFKLFYFNPDSSAGGLIEECPFDVVDATEMIGNKDYMDVLAEHTHYLSEVNSEHFFGAIFGLLEMKRDGLYLGYDVDSVCKQIEQDARGLMETLADAQEKSVRLVSESVVGVGDFLEDDEKKKALNGSFVLRNKTLDVCYGIPGYEKLAKEDKKQLYDLVKKAISMDLEQDISI